MYLSESFRIWRKRRYLTAALLAAALAGSGAAVTTLPRTYQANSSVILLASRTAASPYGGNPYLSFSPSLTLAADAVSRELMGPGIVLSLAARGFSASYTVALAPYTTTTTGSVLLVTVSGSDKITVERTLSAVTRDIGVKLAQLQGKVIPSSRIRAATLSFAPKATLSVSQTGRSLVPVVALGLLLALGIPIIVDAQITRRRLRRAAKPQQAATPERAAEPAAQLLDGRRGRAERRRAPDLSPAHGQSGRSPAASGRSPTASGRSPTADG
jgi:hypothetical protein